MSAAGIAAAVEECERRRRAHHHTTTPTTEEHTLCPRLRYAIEAMERKEKRLYGGVTRCYRSLAIDGLACTVVILGLGHPAYTVAIHYGLASALVHKFGLRDGYAIALCFTLETITARIVGH